MIFDIIFKAFFPYKFMLMWGGGDDKEQLGYPTYQRYEIPEFFQDEYYKPTQDFMWQFGQDILSGKLPDFFSQLGKIGSPQSEAVLGSTIRDTVSGMEESAAKRGVGRGMSINPSISKAVADTSANWRWNDMVRALGEQGDLLKLGSGLITDVRTAGLTNQSQKNSYEISKAGLEIGQNQFQYGADQDYFDYDLSQQGGSSIWDLLGGNLFGGGGMGGGGGDIVSAAGKATGLDFENMMSVVGMGSADEDGKKQKTDWMRLLADAGKIAMMFV